MSEKDRSNNSSSATIHHVALHSLNHSRQVAALTKYQHLKPTTSTASPLLFPGLPSEVSSSSAVVVKLNFTRARQTPHCPVDTNSLLRELHVAGLRT